MNHPDTDPGRGASEAARFTSHLRGVVEALADLVGRHLDLARIELKEDTRQLMGEVGEVAAFTPLLFVGYALLSTALALFLRRFLDVDVAFLLVAVANITVGLVGVSFAVRRLRTKHLLDDTREEVDTTVAALGSDRN